MGILYSLLCIIALAKLLFAFISDQDFFCLNKSATAEDVCGFAVSFNAC